jgi:hypothetical protein
MRIAPVNACMTESAVFPSAVSAPSGPSMETTRTTITIVRPDLEAFMRQTHQSSHAAVVGLLRQGQADGAIPPDTDVERAAVALFALADGLVSHVLLDHYTGDAALRAIEDQLDRVFRA